AGARAGCGRARVTWPHDTRSPALGEGASGVRRTPVPGAGKARARYAGRWPWRLKGSPDGPNRTDLRPEGAREAEQGVRAQGDQRPSIVTPGPAPCTPIGAAWQAAGIVHIGWSPGSCAGPVWTVPRAGTTYSVRSNAPGGT